MGADRVNVIDGCRHSGAACEAELAEWLLSQDFGTQFP